MRYFVVCGIKNGVEEVLDYDGRDDCFFFIRSSFDRISSLAKFKSIAVLCSKLTKNSIDILKIKGYNINYVSA